MLKLAIIERGADLGEAYRLREVLLQGERAGEAGKSHQPAKQEGL
jgi:hypothetical protein